MLIKSISKVFDLIIDAAEKEFTDEKPLKSRLMELSNLLDEGEITQEEYDFEERIIIEKLKQIRKYVKENNDEYDEEIEEEDDEEYEEYDELEEYEELDEYYEEDEYNDED